MATLAELCVTQPANTHGTPVGYSTWDLVVEIATPKTGEAVWGAEYGTVWGTPTVWSNGYEWHDISHAVRGITYGRGTSSTADRPRVGTCQITMANNAGTWSTWKRYTYPYLDIGSVIRIAVSDRSTAGAQDVAWWPRFTGRVEAIDDETVDLDADRFITVYLAETIADLAKIDENAIAGTVGGPDPDYVTSGNLGDTPAQRAIRLLDRAAFPFPYTTQLSAAHTALAAADTTVYKYAVLQGTNFAGNRLGELYLSGDSGMVHFLSHRDGSIRMVSQRPQYMSAAGRQWGEIAQGSPKYVAPWTTFTVNADEEGVITAATIAAAGGTATTYEVIGKTGRIEFARSDLIFHQYVEPGVITVDIGPPIAEYLVTEVRNYRNTSRVTVQFDVLTDATSCLPAVMATDILTTTHVYREMTRQGGTDARTFTVWLMAEQHDITPLNDGAVMWSGSYTFAVTATAAFGGYLTP